MAEMLALIGVTGKKSGGVLAEQISKNLSLVNEIFPGGIRALVRKSSKTDRLKSQIKHIQICSGSLQDIDYLSQSFAGIDTIIHVAGIQYSREIVKAAAACRVRRIILVHTTGVYSNFKSASEEYKHIDNDVIRICQSNNLIFTICRPTMIYGNIYDNNMIKFIKLVDRLPIMPIINGAKYELQPVHYTDLGEAYFKILLNEDNTANKEFNLSGGSPISLGTVLTIIGEHLGKRVHFINCPFPIAYAGAWVLYCLTFRKKDFREKVQRLCETRTFAFVDAANAFGYNPIGFKEGIAAEIQEYMNMKSG